MRESGSVTRLRSLGQGHSTRSKVTPRLAIKYTKNKQLFLFAIDGSGGSRISLRRARQPKKPNFPENYMIMKKIGPGGEFAGLPLRIVLRGGSNYLKTTAWTISFPGWGVGWEGRLTWAPPGIRHWDMVIWSISEAQHYKTPLFKLRQKNLSE